MTEVLLAPRTTTSADFISAARVAAEVAGRHAAQADTERRLSPDVVRALSEAGFARAMTPTRFGGAWTDFGTLSQAVAVVAEQCASAAWIGSLLAYTARFATYLPERGQEDLWGRGPDTRLVSSLVSAATATVVDGGWEISGTWSYASGVEFSDWALVMTSVSGEQGGENRFFAVPRHDYTYNETWLTVGMRATGSHELVIDKAFVPAHRSFLLDDVFAGHNAHSDDPRHSLPLFSVNGLTFGIPVLGAARAALDLSARGLAAKAHRGTPASDNHQIVHARAAGQIDAANLLLDRVALSLAHPPLGGSVLARNRRDCALAAQLLASATDALFQAGGTRSQLESEPLQRIWRDVHAAASHMVLQFEPAALAYTGSLLGAA